MQNYKTDSFKNVIDKLKSSNSKKYLILGNGFSISLYNDFNYKSIIQNIKKKWAILKSLII